jgi:hypothetical protein
MFARALTISTTRRFAFRTTAPLVLAYRTEELLAATADEPVSAFNAEAFLTHVTIGDTRAALKTVPFFTDVAPESKTTVQTMLPFADVTENRRGLHTVHAS